MVEISFGTFLIIIGLVILNGFFVASEFSLVRVRESRIKELIENGSKRAKRVEMITRDLNRTTSSAQLGITLSSIMLGFIGEAFFSEIIISIIGSLGGDVSNSEEGAVSIAAFLLGYMIITYMHVTFGELIPKVVSIQFTEKTALWCATPLYIFMRITNPLLNFFIWSANGFLRIVGISIANETPSQEFSENELKIIIEESANKGEIDEYESKLIFNVLDFTDRVVKELITPRIDIQALPSTASEDDILQFARNTGFSRIPIYGKNLDDMVGFVHIKDLLTFHNSVDNLNLENTFNLEKILRSITIVHEAKHIHELLIEMQKSKTQLAIVIDEYGSVEGLITIEDIIEELVGNIQDEFDESKIYDNIEVNGNSINVGGLVTIETFNKTTIEKFDRTIEAADSVTLAGYVFELFDSEIPQEGQEIVDAGLKYKIEKLNGNRIEVIEVSRVNGKGVGTEKSEDS